MSDAGHEQLPGVASLCFCDGTPRRAFLTALVVGCVLVAINQGDIILAGGALPWLKIVLTFCVPHCVATWGAVTGKRAMLKKQMGARGA